MAQYANVNFDTYIKEADLIKTVPVKNPVPENINPVKILDDFVKISLKIKRSRRILISTTFLKIFKVEIDQLWVHYKKLGLHLSQPDYPRSIQ